MRSVATVRPLSRRVMSIVGSRTKCGSCRGAPHRASPLADEPLDRRLLVRQDGEALGSLHQVSQMRRQGRAHARRPLDRIRELGRMGGRERNDGAFGSSCSKRAAGAGADGAYADRGYSRSRGMYPPSLRRRRPRDRRAPKIRSGSARAVRPRSRRIAIAQGAPSGGARPRRPVRRPRRGGVRSSTRSGCPSRVTSVGCTPRIS